MIRINIAIALLFIALIGTMVLTTVALPVIYAQGWTDGRKDLAFDLIEKGILDLNDSATAILYKARHYLEDREGF